MYPPRKGEPTAPTESVFVDLPVYKGGPIFTGAGSEKWGPIPPIIAHVETRRGHIAYVNPDNFCLVYNYN